jgi:hypothetical protein
MTTFLILNVYTAYDAACIEIGAQPMVFGLT